MAFNWIYAQRLYQLLPLYRDYAKRRSTLEKLARQHLVCCTPYLLTTVSLRQLEAISIPTLEVRDAPNSILSRGSPG